MTSIYGELTIKEEDIAASIDGTKLPVFVYAGEYDFTCPPDHVEESVKQIKGAKYKTLKGWVIFQ